MNNYELQYCESISVCKKIRDNAKLTRAEIAQYMYVNPHTR